MAERDFLSDPAVAKIVAGAATQAPAFAGAVLSLYFVGRLSATGRVIAVLTGLACAIFLGPALAALADLFWPGDMPGDVRSGIVFMTGLSAVGVLPVMLDTIKKTVGDPWGVIERFIPARKVEPEPPQSSGEA